MSQFKVGDTVRIKSGGPIMTICGYDGAGDVKCGWFNGKGNLRTAMFDPEVLMKVEPFDQEKAAKELVKDLFAGITANLPFPSPPGLDPKEQS